MRNIGVHKSIAIDNITDSSKVFNKDFLLDFVNEKSVIYIGDKTIAYNLIIRILDADITIADTNKNITKYNYIYIHKSELHFSVEYYNIKKKFPNKLLFDSKDMFVFNNDFVKEVKNKYNYNNLTSIKLNNEDLRELLIIAAEQMNYYE